MTDAQPWTIGRLLNWTTDYLREHDSQSPRLDAEVLLAHARQCQRIDLYTSFNEVADEQTKVAFREMVRRRAESTPVPYLVGSKEFYSLPFQVTPDVLIPRPETELLVVALLDKAAELSSDGRPLRIADVGTGSGILAVCAAKHLPTCQVTAVDISPPALAIAHRNAEQHEVSDRITFVESDLLSGLAPDFSFDIILSNPPYVSEDEFEELAPDVRMHEPHLALLAGNDGTAIIERLLPQAAERLASDGWLMIEISPMIAQRVQDLFEASQEFDSPLIRKDFDQHARIVLARRV